MTKTPIRFADLFRYYKGLPHQIAAIEQLGELIPPSLLHRENEWFKTWSQAGKQPDPVANTWSGVIGAAEAAGARYPELVAAQWALESDWGQRPSGAHNYFGLKGKGVSKPTQEFINGEWVTITDQFIDFPDLRTSVQYLVDRWYKDFEKYKGVNNAKDRNQAAQMLVAEGYATDPKYASKLIALMDQHAPVEPKVVYGNPLTVPWYSQRDSVTNQADRMCFSSSCAMLLETLKPGTLKGPNGDDQYLQRVQQYGDTTDSNAQIKALASYGVKATYTQKADFSTLEKQIALGIPIPCGYLHRGPVTKPSGGGHWLTVVGHTPTHLIVHDPYGEADLVNGATLNKPARYCHYSRKNFGPRWMVEGKGTGWAIIATR